LIGCDSNPIFSGTTQRLVDVILRPGPIFPDQVTTAYPRGLLLSWRPPPSTTPASFSFVTEDLAAPMKHAELTEA
jgi:hypothetical protein